MKFLKRGTCQEKGRSTPWEDERSNNKYIRGKFKFTRKNSDFVQVDNKKKREHDFYEEKKGIGEQTGVQTVSFMSVFL